LQAEGNHGESGTHQHTDGLRHHPGGLHQV